MPQKISGIRPGRDFEKFGIDYLASVRNNRCFLRISNKNKPSAMQGCPQTALAPSCWCGGYYVDTVGKNVSKVRQAGTAPYIFGLLEYSTVDLLLKTTHQTPSPPPPYLIHT